MAEIGALLSSGKLTGIVGVPTSKRTFEQAQSLGIPLSTLDEHPRLDLAIDGADEVCYLYYFVLFDHAVWYSFNKMPRILAYLGFRFLDFGEVFMLRSLED